MNKLLRVALTSGDIDGIGPEVTAKALLKIRPQKDVQFFLWRSHTFPKKYLRLIDKHFYRETVRDWPSALKVRDQHYKSIIDINSSLPPAKWVEQMGKAGLSKSVDALVTAPLSKTGIIDCGMKDSGHTGILKRVTKSPEVFMTFLGKHFNVCLLTGHTSIKKAYDQIQEEPLQKCLELLNNFRPALPRKIRHRPIGLVGCNPHAGEKGIIDKKELLVFSPVLQKMKKRSIVVTNPLVPDVCFQERYWNQYSFYLASYHDQGLIPFKMVHGAKSGVQISIGLPFVRTSVDHGTAKDIFGKNKADENSMAQAIDVAINILKNKPFKW